MALDAQIDLTQHVEANDSESRPADGGQPFRRRKSLPHGAPSVCGFQMATDAQFPSGDVMTPLIIRLRALPFERNDFA